MTKTMRYIDELKTCSTVFLACSAGIDSMVLLYILSSENIPVHVLHANFKLRGVDSDSDALFLAEHCKQYGIPFTVKIIDVASQMKNNQQSIQQLARDLRYNWFEECLTASPKSLLCTAHHANDSIEQLWIRLLSSGSLLACQGIPAKRNRIRRPMIDWSKDEILKFAMQHSISWRDDASNTQTKYTRNAIRLDLIPVMEKIDPRAKTASQRLMREVARLQHECRTQITQILGADIREHQFFVDQKLWGNALTIWKEVLLAHWKNSTLGLAEIEKLQQNGGLGKIVSFDDFYVMKEMEGLWFGRHSKDIMKTIYLEKAAFQNIQANKKKPSNAFDISDKNTLVIRKINPGEQLFIPHQNKYRAVKKVFNDQKWLFHRRKSAIGFFADDVLVFVFSIHDATALFDFKWNYNFLTKNLKDFVEMK